MSKRKKQLCLCINNDEYPASLEVNKLYLMLPNKAGGDIDMIRVVDESGADYLYPSEYFVILPQEFFALLDFPVTIQRKILRGLQTA